MEDEHSLSEHARRAAHAYGAAADHYRLASLSFWDRFGAATVARLPLAAGDSVLDLCCGAGASAIPAARAVGSAAGVLGIDVAEPLLELARARAARAGLANIEFRYEDATCTGLPDGCFDAVVCVFGVFFAPDMPAFAAEMWRLVRPGGVLAITTWGPGLFEPANSCSGSRSVRSSRRWSGRSTRGMRSPPHPRWRGCSPARPSWPPLASTSSTGQTASGTSCSAPVTGLTSTRSATTSASGCTSACSASCGRATSPPSAQT